jgi:Ice-binding-like
MNRGVPRRCESSHGGSLAASRKPLARAGAASLRAALIVLASLSTLLFASTALGAAAPVGLGTAASFSVLAGSTVTNTGPTTMFGDLGLSPGSSVTGAPEVLGATHVDDAVAIGAKNALTTAYNNAAGRPSNGSAGTDLAGQVFLPGVRTASSSLLLSSGSVTLDAQGNPNAVFIFQIGTTLITGSNTSVQLINGAQACNVFWQVGSSATLGTGTRFVGTIMALATITANTAATIHGRLLASTAAVNLDTNTITTSNCPSSETGVGGGLEGSSGGESTSGGSSAGGKAGGGAGATAKPGTTGSKKAAKRKHRHVSARPALPHHHGGFTG